MNSSALRSRVAIITGSTSGIGLAIAQELLKEGAFVVLNGRRKKILEQLQIELEALYPGKVTSVPGNVADQEVITQLFEHCENTFGHSADIVVANAGRGLLGSTTTANLADLEEVLQTNIVAVSRLLQDAGKRLSEIAASKKQLERPLDIVVIGSTVGRNLSPFSGIYSGTKFAVHAITESLRRELAPRGIRVSLIEPGIVETGFQDVAGVNDAMIAGWNEKFGPLLKPEDIAGPVAFLLSLPAHVHLNELMIRPTRQDYP